MEDAENKNKIPSSEKKKLRPAHIIVLGFLGVILIGSFFLCLPAANKSGQWLFYPDALFTATSAVCVTGLAVVSTAVNFNVFGQIILLLLIQVGGIGFMTITTLFMLILRRKITLKDRIALQEALNTNETRGVVRLARNILFVTLIIEGAGAVILIPSLVIMNGAEGVWQGIFTSVSAFCNAGFDIFGTPENPFPSLTAYAGNAAVCLTVSFLIILGGMGFTVIMDIIKNKWRFKKFRLHTKAVLTMTGILLLVGFAAFASVEWSASMKGMNGGETVLSAWFQSVTARTAGFNSVDQSELNPVSKVLTMVLMFIGASPGSTGGGVKTTTFMIVVIMMICGLRSKNEVTMYRKNISYKNCFKAVSVLLVSLLTVILLALVLLLTEKTTMPPELYSAENMFFEAFSAFGTVGLSAGVTPHLSVVGKIAVMIVMFFGRVGPMTIGLMFLNRKPDLISYPEGTLLIG